MKADIPRPIAATRAPEEGLGDVAARSVTILGATGSIGVNTADVILHARKVYGPHAFPVTALTAGGNVQKLIELARALRPALAVIGDESLLDELKAGLSGTGIEAAGGRQAVIDAAARPSDFVMVAIMGAAAIEPALAAIRRGCVVALANKECVVAAGAVFRAAMEASGAAVLPVDSEHNAVFQCIEGHPPVGLRRIVLTASGGAFRDWPLERLTQVTPADAVKHPNWAMGPKITVDSATLANKGLELIEAQWLFGLRADQCHAVLHPQSIVHCVVEFADGAMLSQLSPPSMTFPIQHALLHPQRAPGVETPLDFTQVLSLEFRPVDEERFPMLRLAKEVMAAGGIAPTVYNAANEIAVAGFLEGRIPFLAIPQVVEHTVRATENFEPSDLPAVLGADADARRVATAKLKTFSS